MWKSFKKYVFAKKAMILYISLCVILGISYIITLYFENTYTTVASSVNQVNNFQQVLLIIDILKNLTLTAFTIFLSTLLSSIIIEKKQKNETALDAIVNDVLLCDEFDKIISDKHKEKMYHRYIDYKYGRSDKALLEMLQSINSELSAAKGDFFFEKCSFIIECTPTKRYIQKKITRTIQIKSYEGQKEIKDFLFASSALRELPGEKVFEVKEIVLNGKTLVNGVDYECIREPVSDKFHKKSGYNVYNKCISKEKISVDDQDGAIISINYITKVDIKDNIYNCRVSEHCRNFSMQFTINSKEKYDISPVAFGFIDDAQYTPNSDDTNSVNLNFNNWIFRKDGVSISFKKRN